MSFRIGEILSIDFTPLEKAVNSLKRALDRAIAAQGDEELRDTCVLRFEYTFELCWKMLKRQLEQELPNPTEVEGYSYRQLFRIIDLFNMKAEKNWRFNKAYDLP
jgi:hypothetical protein